MTLTLGFAGLIAANAAMSFDSSAIAESNEREIQLPTVSTIHYTASAYGTLGGYSTDTRSQAASAYLTLDNAWLDYYTLGFASLWLNRDDAGGNYYQQQLLSARASWLFNYRVNLAVHLGFLNEGEIQSFSSSARFLFVGTGVNYWFSPTEVAGASTTLSFSDGKMQSNMFAATFSLHLFDGVWTTSSVSTSKADWSPRLFVARQSVSIPIAEGHFIEAVADVGRRVFHFDDLLLLVYNQREVQTRRLMLKGTVKLTSNFFLIPVFEYDTFDSYNVKYGSLGVKVLF